MIKDINPPGVEAFSLDYAKTFLRVDTDKDDQIISDLIRSSREQIETRLNASLITRRRLYRTEKLSDSGLLINHSPVTAIHKVTAYDADGQPLEILPTTYRVNLNAVPGHFQLDHPLRWASMGEGICSVDIELDAGYGAEAEDIPMPLRQACLLMLGYSYEYRDSEYAPPWPPMIEALIMPYRSLTL